MSLIISINRHTNEWLYHRAFGLSDIFGIGMALLERGDDLIHIAPNKSEYAVSVEQIYSAKRNRDQFIREGVACHALPSLAV
jgi:hypothetical protein